MLTFSFHQFELGGRYFALLPKLTGLQVATFEERLKALGFRTNSTDLLRAVKGGVTVTLDKAGLCWSNRDVTDILVPATPSVLSSKKQTVATRLLASAYFEVKKREGGLVLRLSPRLESSLHWRLLRAADSCALAPDEHAVYRLLFANSSLESEVLTDYPTEGCAVRRIGRKQYYSSIISGDEVADTLKEVGTSHPRNSYLPRDSLLRLSSLKVSPGALAAVLQDLGEWCFFRPASGSRKL